MALELAMEEMPFQKTIEAIARLPPNTSLENFICHISEEDKALNHAKEFKKCLHVSLNGLETSALLDGGNDYRSCISDTLATNLGLTDKDLRPVDETRVGTAKADSNLLVIGEPKKPLRMNVHGVNFKFRPVIVQGLSMDVNISGPWMHSHNWDQLYGKNQVRIQGRNVNLQPKEDVSLALYAMEKVVVPAHTKMKFYTRTNDARLDAKLGTQGHVEGSMHFAKQTDLLPTRNLLVKPHSGFRIPVGVWNNSDSPRVIKKGQRFGTYSPAPNASINEISSGQFSHDVTLDLPKTQKDRDQFVKDLMHKAKKVETTDLAAESHHCRTTEERAEWLIEMFKLREAECLQKPEDFQKALSLLLHFWDVFAHKDQYGHTKLVEHVIDTGDHKPIKQRYRPISPALEEDFKRQLEEWLEQDICEESFSDWSSPPVGIRKKSGKIRWCLDWRAINEITKTDAYPMPQVNDTIRKLAGSSIFSGLDLKGAFHVIPIRKSDREKTAFATPWGHFQFKRLGFGLKNGPPAYCRLVAEVLKGIPTSMVVGFMDDAVVHSATVDDHIRHLFVTLSAYKRAGLKLGADKCSFFRKEIIYLGHLIDKNGIRPPPSFVDSVKQWPIPVLKTHARTFMGLMNYYSSHIPNFAKRACPWTAVTGTAGKEEERKPLVITPEMKKAFYDLKEALTKAPVLGYPYFKGPKAGIFVLDTDFCKEAIGAVLSQVQKDKEVVIAYGSAKCNKSQQNYPSTKGELMAGVHFMKKFRYYLAYTQKFLWRTDNSALKFCKTMENQGPTISRWLMELQEFNFEVQHRAGKAHANADGLSRLPGPKEQLEEDIVKPYHNISAIQTRDEHGVLLPLHQLKMLARYSDGELLQLQNEDPDLKLVRGWLVAKELPAKLELRALSPIGKAYAQQFESLYVGHQGHIRIKLVDNPASSGMTAFCLPKLLWDDCIRLAHAQAGHMATETTYKQMKRAVYFPSMKKEITGFIRACETCQRKEKGPPAPQKHTLVSPSVGYPFQRIHIDFVGPLNKTKRGNKYILTVRDAFTKWVEAIPLPTMDTEAMISALDANIFCRFGLPDSIHSDMGPQFTSHMFLEMGRMLGIKLTNTSGYNPKSNGVVERMHRDLTKALNAIQQESPESWDLCLPQALFALRCAHCATTGMSPYMALFGRDPSAPLDVIFNDPNDHAREDVYEHRNFAKYIKNMRAKIEAAHTFIRNNIQKAVIRQRRQYVAEQKWFAVGTKVWLYTPKSKPGIPRKFTNPWTGPWVVCATPASSQVMVRITPDPSWSEQSHRKQVVVSMDRLKPYWSDKIKPPDPEDDLDMEGDEFAEVINLGKQDLPQDDSDSSEDEVYGNGAGPGPAPRPPPPRNQHGNQWPGPPGGGQGPRPGGPGPPGGGQGPRPGGPGPPGGGQGPQRGGPGHPGGGHNFGPPPPFPPGQGRPKNGQGQQGPFYPHGGGAVQLAQAAGRRTDQNTQYSPQPSPVAHGSPGSPRSPHQRRLIIPDQQPESGEDSSPSSSISSGSSSYRPSMPPSSDTSPPDSPGQGPAAPQADSPNSQGQAQPEPEAEPRRNPPRQRIPPERFQAGDNQNRRPDAALMPPPAYTHRDFSRREEILRRRSLARRAREMLGEFANQANLQNELDRRESNQNRWQRRSPSRQGYSSEDFDTPPHLRHEARSSYVIPQPQVHPAHVPPQPPAEASSASDLSFVTPLESFNQSTVPIVSEGESTLREHISSPESSGPRSWPSPHSDISDRSSIRSDPTRPGTPSVRFQSETGTENDSIRSKSTVRISPDSRHSEQVQDRELALDDLDSIRSRSTVRMSPPAVGELPLRAPSLDDMGSIRSRSTLYRSPENLEQRQTLSDDDGSFRSRSTFRISPPGPEPLRVPQPGGSRRQAKRPRKVPKAEAVDPNGSERSFRSRSTRRRDDSPARELHQSDEAMSSALGSLPGTPSTANQTMRSLSDIADSVQSTEAGRQSSVFHQGSENPLASSIADSVQTGVTQSTLSGTYQQSMGSHSSIAQPDEDASVYSQGMSQRSGISASTPSTRSAGVSLDSRSTLSASESGSFLLRDLPDEDVSMGSSQSTASMHSSSRHSDNSQPSQDPLEISRDPLELSLDQVSNQSGDEPAQNLPPTYEDLFGTARVRNRSEDEDDSSDDTLEMNHSAKKIKFSKKRHSN